jgi:hypothetical protein
VFRARINIKMSDEEAISADVSGALYEGLEHLEKVSTCNKCHVLCRYDAMLPVILLPRVQGSARLNQVPRLFV